MQKIKAEKALEQDAIFIDTRSPAEFSLDHLPNAINLPILDNKERKTVGTLYKKDPEKAIELGYNYYGKKLDKIKDKIRKLPKKKIIVYCWRGGMRSETITKLVEDLNHNAFQLEGGYKAYRKYMRDFFGRYKPKFKFIVLTGMAGCGKTDLIKKLKPSLDLEGLAQHRSSIFGAIGLKPRTQKAFETLLYVELKKLESAKLVFVEGESKKIGNVFIPANIFNAMEKGIIVKVNCSIKNRAKRIVRDYFTHDEDKKIKELINQLRQHLTNKVVEELLILVDKKEYEKVSKVLLEDYYDLRYKIEDHKYEVNNDSVSKCVKELEKLKNP
ncbi:MAG: tRNA 2-selenouridine(34) synthase MnmH [Candidatus Woesearchaeota archaeon]